MQKHQQPDSKHMKGRGIYGMITGLNAVYETRENRGYFHVRFLSVLYTFAFLLVIIP